MWHSIIINLYCACIPGHMALGDATEKAGKEPVQGVTFQQPGCILNYTHADPVEFSLNIKYHQSLRKDWSNLDAALPNK